MNILERIAQDIVDRTSEILQYPISITDNEGYIMGASDKSRIGNFHQPSLEVVKKNRMIDCISESENKVLPGVSVPLKFNNHVIGVLGIVGDPREVDNYVQLVKNQVEMMCLEAFGKEMVELKEKMVEVFVHQIIHYKENDEKDPILHYSRLLGIDLQTDRICLLVDIHNLSEKMAAKKGKDDLFGDFPLRNFQREIVDYLNLILIENEDDIVSVLNIERFIVIKSLPFKQSHASFIESLDKKLDKLNSFLERKYQVSAFISVGDVSHGMMGVAESYKNAKKAMNLGVNSETTSSIHQYNEREMMLRLLPKELSADYQEKLLTIISPLIKHDNYEALSTTFTAYCKYNMKLSETSRNMYIHRNTLIYRLERISEITSLDTGNFKHCMLLYTAIQYYEDIRIKQTTRADA